MKTIKQTGIIVFIFLLFSSSIFSQTSETITQYIHKYQELAIQEMHRTGVPASITLAQGIHETTAGTSILVLKSNNHFGIKCKSNWQGESVSHTDDAPNECFRKYNAPEDSYKDHSDFLKNNSRYGFLFTLDPLDYKGWAFGLKKAGYATNPKYAPTLIDLIEKYNLQDYSLLALNGNWVKPIAPPQPQPVVEQVAIVAAAPPAEPKYPAGEFKINETRVIYAQKGTPFFSIAEQYNIPLARLFDFNDLPEAEIVEKNRLIYLQRKRRIGNEIFHIVQPAETLLDICQTQAIRLEALMELNFISNKKVQPAIGEKLYLKEKAPAMPKLALLQNNTH